MLYTGIYYCSYMYLFYINFKTMQTDVYDETVMYIVISCSCSFKR